MRRPLRETLFWAGALPAAAGLAWASCRLPAFGSPRGSYGLRLVALAVERRNVPNAVAGVMFDLRGIDTLIEEMIFVAAVAGATLLLRQLAGERREEPEDEAPSREHPPTTAAVQLLGRLLAAFGLVLGGLLVGHAHLSPGGGFQGGLALAAGLLAVYLTWDYERFVRRAPLPVLEWTEAVAAAGLVLLGLAGVVAGGAFLVNVLPTGGWGSLLSGGTIPLFSFASGLAVGAGFVLTALEFIRQTLILREGRWYR